MNTETLGRDDLDGDAHSSFFEWCRIFREAFDGINKLKEADLTPTELSESLHEVFCDVMRQLYGDSLDDVDEAGLAKLAEALAAIFACLNFEACPPASLDRLTIRRNPPMCHKVDYGLPQPPETGRLPLDACCAVRD